MEEEDDVNRTDGEKSKVMSAIPSVNYEEDGLGDSDETKVKCDAVSELGEAEHSEKNDETTTAQMSATNRKGFDTSTEAVKERGARGAVVRAPTPGPRPHSRPGFESSPCLPLSDPLQRCLNNLSIKKQKHSKEDVKEHEEVINKSSNEAMSDQSAEEKDILEDTSPTPQTASTDKEVMPELLTVVVIGDTNNVDIGAENLLLDPENVQQLFSYKLYDLCGQHIYFINMLGLQNIKKFPLYQEIHAFLLLLENGQPNRQYSSGVQCLEKAFGKESIDYLMTVVTHKPDEKCESAVIELKSNSSFVEKRYHTCTRSMNSETEIIGLLEKIHAMVSENGPPYPGQMCDGNKEKKEHLDKTSQNEEKMDDQHQTEEELGENAAEIKRSETIIGDVLSVPSAAKGKDKEIEDSSAQTEHDPVNDPVDVEHSEKNEDITAIGGESEIMYVPSATKNKGAKMSENKDEQSMEITEEFKTLLGRLDLQEKLQKKFSTADFLKIGPPLKQENDTCDKDLAYTFLQRLMMLDYTARYIPVRQDSPDVSQTKPDPVFDDDEDALFSAGEDSVQSKPTHVHPMDVQMAVFHCSDSFFKQNMITKLSKCQYALPLLVPDPVTKNIQCPLWTFRQIIKTWKITEKLKDESISVTMKSEPICTAKTPMVSFFRLGPVSLSKSQLINTLINDRHSTFFHRNCPGSTKSRHLMDGVAEIAWYCPSGKPNDAFNDCIAFGNLHGDALQIETLKQREIMSEKASVNVVLVQTLEKGKKSTTVISALLKSPKPLIILIADNTCDVVKIKEGKYKMGLKDKSQSDVSKELKGIIGKFLTGSDASFQLETMAEVSGITVDENDTVCQNGKSAAMNLLQGMDVSKVKDKCLTCQGQLWHDWCKINKELHRLKGNVEQNKAEKKEEQTRKREDQCKASNEFMKSFIESLSTLPSAERMYFLKWTRILVDSLSSDNISNILQDYDKKWSEVLVLKEKVKENDTSDDLKSKQTELDTISKTLQSATFGLEHIFREMGQIYEAHKSLNKPTKPVQTDWSTYPEMAAELMISGHPMELMDGDAGHVPLTWITSLLDEVIKKLGDQRVFVLSVLGVQSSGKSTMLNAMFGLQFAVSAGRCTKGAFMQLVKVSEEIRKDFKFDYILVVDTEGLRSSELAGNATLHHDNELATFVVGLGNMTLINIFGENPSEMQEVLQIVVQAFMRMKKVKLSPSCLFVHQNVSDISATEKNMDGKRQLQEKLDQMARLAAKEEECDAKCFSDVIEFDVQKDVKYFAQLWEGSPPMAPPNPGYSESIQELKKLILSKAQTAKGMPLSQFKSNIVDLWNALINENFVFSFKNTLEIAVYRKLEVQYGNWTWALRSNMLTIENNLCTRIKNRKHDKDEPDQLHGNLPNDLYGEMTETFGNIQKGIKNGKLDKVEPNELYGEMTETFGNIQKEIKTYFDEDKDKDMLVQWRGLFESKIKEFHDERVKEVKRKLDEVIQQKKACRKLDDKKTEFEDKLLQQSKELASELKDQAKDEEKLKKEFDSVWSCRVKELKAGTKPIEDISFEQDQITILLDSGYEWDLIHGSKSSGKYKEISEVGDYTDYVIQGKESTLEKIGNFIKRIFQKDDQKQIRSLIEDVEKQSLAAITKKPVATNGYNRTYLQEVANLVKKIVTEFESGRNYTMKKEFMVDLILYVFFGAEGWFSKTHKEFKKNNDALTYLEGKKEETYLIFKSFCRGSSSAVVLGELICKKLKSSVVEAVCNRTAIDLAGVMRCDVPAFSGNRLNLEKHVLRSLAKTGDFKGFITYIHDAKKQAETFIKEEVEKYIFTEQREKARKILKKNVEDNSGHLSLALSNATEKVKTPKGNIDMWEEEFSSCLKDELTFNISCQNFRDINDFDFLKDEIKKGLVSIIDEMKNLPLEKIKESRKQPDQILIDQLCDCCWAKCPFCNAVCTNTMADHPKEHSVPFHRPGAVAGVHWNKTDEMFINFCSTNVASDLEFYANGTTKFPYKLYQTAGPEFAKWSITPDNSEPAYWKSFVWRFKDKLENHYGHKFHGRGEIPSEWRKHSETDAIKSLDVMFTVVEKQ